MTRTTFIYALVDPRDEKVHYVGKSNDPRRRLYEHMKQQHPGVRSTQKFEWLNELKAVGLQPRVLVLEEVPFDEWHEAERRWLNYYRYERRHPVHNFCL